MGFFKKTGNAAKDAAAAAEAAAASADAAVDAVERGVSVAEEQGNRLNEAVERGNVEVKEQGDRLNETAEHGVDVVEEQGQQLNETAERGVGVIEEQGEQLNETAERGVGVIEEQGEQLNETAVRGVDAIQEQATELNMTAEEAARELGRAVDSFEESSEVVANAIELWSPSINVILDIIGPLQVLAGFNYFTLILKNMGFTRAVPQSIRQLDVTNTILQDMADTYREVESKGIVREITKSSVVRDESTKKLTAYFFYTQNNLIVQQLRGSDDNYFAYDSISDLLKAVYCWNAFLHAAASEGSSCDHTDPKLLGLMEEKKDNMKRFGERLTKIYFLDPAPKHMALPLLEFPEIYKDVVVINHCRAKDRLKLESVKVHEGCSVRFEHLTVCEIDETCTGQAYLHKCDVGWDPHQSDRNVVCNECVKAADPSGIKRKILMALAGIFSLLAAAGGGYVLWSMVGPTPPASPTPTPTVPSTPTPSTPPTPSPSMTTTIQTCETLCGSLRETYQTKVRADLRAAVVEYLRDPSSSIYGPIINCWDVSAITDFSDAFAAEYPWDSADLTYDEFGDLRDLFREFNEPLDCWDTSGATNTARMFKGASSFNQPIGNWDMSRVTDMREMLSGASSFNQPIGGWEVSKVTDMYHMFEGATYFNQPIGDWDVSEVTNMSGMFRYARNFDQPLNGWRVSKVLYMSYMFSGSGNHDYVFNQPLDEWDVSNVIDMNSMFENATFFNKPIGNWDVSAVIQVRSMFRGTKYFNQPLDNWDMTSAKNLSDMFSGAESFNQNLCSWGDYSAVRGIDRGVTLNASIDRIFHGSGCKYTTTPGRRAYYEFCWDPMANWCGYCAPP